MRFIEGFGIELLIVGLLLKGRFYIERKGK